MSDPVIITLIVSINGLLTTGLAAWIKTAQDNNHQQAMEATEVVRKDVNGKMDRLLKVDGDAREAKGNLAGHAEAAEAAAQKEK